MGTQNQITATGIETKDLATLISDFTTDMQAAYGPDIILTSDSPDGQSMMITIQAARDALDLAEEVFSSFDPDKAVGTVLDQRVGINGIQRQAGTYTVTNVTVTTTNDLSQNLIGLDTATDPSQVFTVADDAGTQWLLETTQSGLTAGAHVLVFRAANTGKTLTIPNTITTIVTIIVGVTAVNNPTTYTTLGTDEETDAALHVRRQKSVSAASQGYFQALLAALQNVAGVTSAFIYENTGDTTDGNGVPGHSIWVIIAGAPAAADVAAVIYQKRNAGCGMRGGVAQNVTQADGSTFTVRWDTVTTQNLYVSMFLQSLNGTDLPNVTALLDAVTGLLATFVPGVGASANVNALTTQIQTIDPNSVGIPGGFALTASGIYQSVLAPSSKNQQLTLAAARILFLYALTNTIARGGQIQFHASGGTAPYTFAVIAGAGSINSGTGLYTAGAGAGQDVVEVQDANGILASGVVTVT